MSESTDILTDFLKPMRKTEIETKKSKNKDSYTEIMEIARKLFKTLKPRKTKK